MASREAEFDNRQPDGHEARCSLNAAPSADASATATSHAGNATLTTLPLTPPPPTRPLMLKSFKANETALIW